MKKVVMTLFLLGVLAFYVVPLASAGTGILWSQQSVLVSENSNVCLTYGIYNPWPKDAYVQVELSDSLKPIIKSYDSSVQMIPKDTSHNESIPTQFCFTTPSVYTQDCLLFNKFLCKQDCSEPMKIYEGEVQVHEVNSPIVQSGGSGGSSTAMSIGAPLAVKVKCNAHGTNYSLVYIVVGLIALLILLWKFYKRKKGKGKKGKGKK